MRISGSLGVVWKYFRSIYVCLKNDQSPCQLASEMARIYNLASLKYTSKKKILLLMKGHSAWSQNRNPNPSSVNLQTETDLQRSASSCSRPQTAQPLSYPQMDGIPVGSPADLDRTQQVPTSLTRELQAAYPTAGSVVSLLGGDHGP